MVNENYEKIVERISKISGFDKFEIERRIEAKRAKLSGLISQEGAAQVVAVELGINLENEKLKIEELLPGMRKVNVSGKIIKVFPVRVFKTQKNGDGKVCNFILADETSNIKVVLWDVHHIEMIEKGEISEDSVVEIKNGSMRENEIHLGSFSELKKSKEIFEKVQKDKIIKEKQISEFKIGDSVSVRAFIVQSFEPKFFEVNKETGRKIKEEEKFEGVTKERRALINLVIDDGTGTIRAVLFHENLKEIGLNDLEDVEKTISQREDLLGKEFIFLGTVRKNNFFNNEEFVVDSVKKINLDELINNFEKK